VKLEEERVADSTEKMQLKVKGLHKVYTPGSGPCCKGEPLTAVERLSFGLKEGDCLALLGVNGSGKSTTFKQLVAQEEPTRGEISIQGMDLAAQFQKVRKLIGYCP
jgi:ABC-type multidrug transport system ATPase subunit